MTYRISVDVGGIFTDVVVADEAGHFTIGKALTDRARAFLSTRPGLGVAAEELGTTVDDLLAGTSMFLYGTTRATNGIVERMITRTAFLTTQGFPNTLLLKEGGRSDTRNRQAGGAPAWVTHYIRGVLWPINGDQHEVVPEPASAGFFCPQWRSALGRLEAVPF